VANKSITQYVKVMSGRYVCCVRQGGGVLVYRVYIYIRVYVCMYECVCLFVRVRTPCCVSICARGYMYVCVCALCIQQ